VKLPVMFKDGLGIKIKVSAAAIAKISSRTDLRIIVCDQRRRTIGVKILPYSHYAI
jgi:hypothetical protein